MRQKRAAKPHVSSPAFQVYPNDITGDPNFQMMNPTQRGCYFSLWLYAWRSLAIPKDFLLLSLLCGITADEMEKAWPRMAVFFTDHPTEPGKLIHTGHEKERAKQAAFKAAKRIAGSKGGRKAKANREAGNGGSKATILLPAKGVAKSTSSSSSSSSSSDSLSPKPPQGEEREGDAIPEACKEGERQSSPRESPSIITSGDTLKGQPGCLSPLISPLLRAEIGAIFRRPASRAWSKSELEALEGIGTPATEDIALLKRFYAAKIEEKKDRRRHNLESLLRNWSGELDKAQGHFTAQQRKDYAL